MDPTKKQLYTDKRASGLVTDADAALTEAVSKFRDGEHNWILNKIQNSKQLVLHGSGDRGFRELLTSLTDDDVYFGAIKATVGGQAKTFHFGYVGPNTSGMKKGKATMQKNAAFSVIDAHGEIFLTCDLSDITEESLMREVSRLTATSLASIQLI